MAEAAPNATIRKFGYPDTLVAEYPHWVVLLRPKQATLGAVVLACKEPVVELPDTSEAAFAELKRVVTDLEAALAGAFAHEKLNYLMLRMVDPHVHFHVLPRYSKARTFEGVVFPDPAWPGPPDLASAPHLAPRTSERLRAHLRAHWPAVVAPA